MSVTKSGLAACSSSLACTLLVSSPGRISIRVLAASFLMLLFLIGPRGRSAACIVDRANGRNTQIWHIWKARVQYSEKAALSLREPLPRDCGCLLAIIKHLKSLIHLVWKQHCIVLRKSILHRIHRNVELKSLSQILKYCSSFHVDISWSTCIGDECKLIDSFNDSRHIFFEVWCLDHILQRAEHARVHLACVVEHQKINRRFVKISQSWRKPPLGPSPGWKVALSTRRRS